MIIRKYAADELWQRLLAHQIDVALQIPWSKHRFLAQLRTIKVDSSSKSIATALVFDIGSPPFKQASRRHDFASLLDRTRVVARTQRGLARAATSFDPAEPDSLPSPREPRFGLDPHAIRVGADASMADKVDVAMEIQREAASHSIDVGVVPLSSTDTFGEEWKGRVQALVSILNSPIPFESVRHHYRYQAAAVNRGPEMDHLFERIAQTDDDTDRRALFRRAEAILQEEMPMTILFWQPLLSAYRAELCGFHMTTPFLGLDRVRPCS
jgi:ABC-type oligopeptide transport system substrate-binding subunit